MKPQRDNWNTVYNSVLTYYLKTTRLIARYRNLKQIHVYRIIKDI